jgi:hypothetical protein
MGGGVADFIKANTGNIIVGFIVFGVLAFTVARLVINFRRGKSSCGCGCGNCPKINGARHSFSR